MSDADLMAEAYAKENSEPVANANRTSSVSPPPSHDEMTNGVSSDTPPASTPTPTHYPPPPLPPQHQHPTPTGTPASVPGESPPHTPTTAPPVGPPVHPTTQHQPQDLSNGLIDLTMGTNHHPQHYEALDMGIGGPSPDMKMLGLPGMGGVGSLSTPSKLACRYCGKTFSQAGYIKAHERLHTGEKPFECSVCGKRFSDPSNWKKHERVHSNKTGSPSNNKSPANNNHQIDRSRAFVLKAVSMVQQNALQQRMRATGGSEMSSAPVVCKICGKVFSSQSSLSTHKRIHTGERPYTCGSCGKSFTQIGTLRTHERIHTGEKPYICKVCGRTFAQSGSYRMHERRHMTDSIQRCHVCYATFTKWQDLQQHMATHPAVSQAMYQSYPDEHGVMDGKEDMKPSHLSEKMMMEAEPPYHPQPPPPPPGLYHGQGQLPPFSSLMPFRQPPGTTFASSFPTPMSVYASPAISLPESPIMSAVRLPYFQPMALPSQLKVHEEMAAENNNVVSTTSQMRKYGAEAHISPDQMNSEVSMEMGPGREGEGENDGMQHPPGSSESSDAGSQSPEVAEITANDEPQQLSIERRNLNTSMISTSSSSRKQRHPMRRYSSASSEQEMPQSTSSLPATTSSLGTRDMKEAEDHALVSYLLSKGKVFKCEHCHIVFEDCTLYLLHNGFHSHDLEPFKCGICKASCKDRIDFNCHLTSHIKWPSPPSGNSQRSVSDILEQLSDVGNLHNRNGTVRLNSSVDSDEMAEWS